MCMHHLEADAVVIHNWQQVFWQKIPTLYTPGSLVALYCGYDSNAWILCWQFVVFILKLFSVAYREGGLWVFQPPPPSEFFSFDKAEPKSHFHGKYIHNNLIRMWVSLICRLSGTPD
jgi:hypothetical protein